MMQVRAADGAGPQVFYQGLADFDIPTTQLPQAGVGNFTEPTMADGFKRVSYLVPIGAEWTAGAAAHGLGHNLNLRHVACSGTNLAENTDPNYPYADGLIGQRGYGVNRHRYYDPFVYWDTMSYCQPRWVSDWTWSRTHAFLATLTSWDNAAPPRDEPLLLGILPPEGEARWVAIRGHLDPEKRLPDASVEVEIGGVRQILSVAEMEVGDSASRFVLAPWPHALDPDPDPDAGSELVELSYHRGATHLTIAPEHILRSVNDWKQVRR